MKHKKNEKGFALVLSLVLLMAMSLLGGSLIVISSGDHRSNNTSDDYQQAFYVAETALIEGEKLIKNVRMGPWVDVETYISGAGTDTTTSDGWDDVMVQLRRDAISNGGHARNIDRREYPQNNEVDASSGLNKNTPCFKSFRNIDRTNIKVYKHFKSGNFGTLIGQIFSDTNLDDLASTEQKTAEEARMKKFRFEYFIVNIGHASFKGEGSSIAKGATITTSTGVAYKIYGCGMMMPDEDSTYLDDEGNVETNPDILIPLESTIVIG